MVDMQMTSTNDSWARRLRMARAGAGLSLRGLAEKSGVHLNTIRSVEAGNPTGDEVKLKLAYALGVDVLELFPFELFPKEIAK